MLGGSRETSEATGRLGLAVLSGLEVLLGRLGLPVWGGLEDLPGVRVVSKTFYGVWDIHVGLSTWDSRQLTVTGVLTLTWDCFWLVL